ncbi:MAG: homogentisate 1,2-dioxygenase [Endozoicomonadaceae bacterium]|nr:homogentisate 1,2-dioxygenase [Endozoicomonadaceae bacterium]
MQNAPSCACRTNALPEGCNSPQKPPYGLIAEQISGTGLSAKRHEN